MVAATVPHVSEEEVKQAMSENAWDVDTALVALEQLSFEHFVASIAASFPMVSAADVRAASELAYPDHAKGIVMGIVLVID